MRTILLFSLAALLAGPSAAQTPGAAAPPPKPQTTPAPQTTPPKPAPARPAQPSPARTGALITATNPQGATIPNIQVLVTGPVERDGVTDSSGIVRFTGMRPGTYRARFSGDQVITFEREFTVRPGQTADVDVKLNPAEERPEPPPPPPAAPAPPPPAAPVVGPAAKPGTVPLLDLLEKEFIGRQPRRESLLACSGNARTTMIQLNEAQPERLYEDAESMYYVMGGEGTVRINGKDTAITTGEFAVVPRGVSHSFARKGRRPLILLATLSGEPCEQAQP